MSHALFRGSRPLRLDTLDLPAHWTVWMLAPHPDDFDAIAVTMRALRDRGCRLELTVVSGSASGVLDGYAGCSSEADKILIREAEQRASCTSFGLPETCLRFLHLEEDRQGDPMDSTGSRDRLRRELMRIQPQLAFLPHGNDTNPGHQRTFAMFRDLVEESTLEMTALYIRDPKTISCRSDVYQPFGEEDAAWKSRLLLQHRSQEHRNRSLRQAGFDERILAANQQTARDLPGHPVYAEAFEIEVFPGTG